MFFFEKQSVQMFKNINLQNCIQWSILMWFILFQIKQSMMTCFHIITIPLFCISLYITLLIYWLGDIAWQPLLFSPLLAFKLNLYIKIFIMLLNSTEVPNKTNIYRYTVLSPFHKDRLFRRKKLFQKDVFFVFSMKKL